MFWPKLGSQARAILFWARAWTCQRQQKRKMAPPMRSVFLACAKRVAMRLLPIIMILISNRRAPKTAQSELLANLLRYYYEKRFGAPVYGAAAWPGKTCSHHAAWGMRPNL